MVDILDMITLNEAAEIIGFSSKNTGGNIAAQCRKGKVPGAIKRGPVWLVPREWASRYRVWLKEQREERKIWEGMALRFNKHSVAVTYRKGNDRKTVFVGTREEAENFVMEWYKNGKK